MKKERKAYIESCEISYAETVELGGYRQKIAVEGRKKDAPVLICLHGGPGSPVPFSVGCRGLFPEFTDNFIMVYWDQLGCGANNYPIDDTFNIEKFVGMASELIGHIKSRFPENKLYLFGMSWGSVLAAHCAARISIVDGVVAYGQIITVPMFSDEAFDAIENSSAPKKEKEFAAALRFSGDTDSIKELMRLSKIIRKYTDGYFNRNAEPIPMGKFIKQMIGPDYRFKDVMAIMKNGYAKNQSLMLELSEIDLRGVLSGIRVPYKIIQGETDIVTGTKSIVEFVNTCGNPSLMCEVVPNMGHFPSPAVLKKIIEFFNPKPNV